MNFWVSVTFSIEAFFTSAYYGKYFFFREVNFPDCMVLGVTQVEEVLVISIYVASALRMVKRTVLKSPIY